MVEKGTDLVLIKNVQKNNCFSRFARKETLKPLLQSVLKILKSPGGADRNIRIKKYISEIKYSPEEIQINLFYNRHQDDDSTFLGGDSLRAVDLRLGAWNSEQAMGGVNVVSNLSDLEKVRNKDFGVPTENRTLINGLKSRCPNR